jgi:hypothetical protein
MRTGRGNSKVTLRLLVSREDCGTTQNTVDVLRISPPRPRNVKTVQPNDDINGPGYVEKKDNKIF